MGPDLVSSLSTEIYHVKAKLQHLVRVELSTEEKSRNFIRSMNSFLDYVEKNLKGLEEDEHKVLHVREITEYFQGDVSKLDEANLLRIML
ncbi:hypothetical protein V6N13_090867 [Hibiscus sabdariffa]|uniref:Uncharacterized protein n=2 Tax=Hibiscus sabdariffa TaxID=183260 RepID=A0ABR2BP53_9ROSI